MSPVRPSATLFAWQDLPTTILLLTPQPTSQTNHKG